MLSRLLILATGVVLIITLAFAIAREVHGVPGCKQVSMKEGGRYATLTEVSVSLFSLFPASFDGQQLAQDEIEHEAVIWICLFCCVLALVIAIWYMRRGT